MNALAKNADVIIFDEPTNTLDSKAIQWFNEYLKTKDEKILERILLYNEDDCKATMILKDAIAKLNQKEVTKVILRWRRSAQ